MKSCQEVLRHLSRRMEASLISHVLPLPSTGPVRVASAPGPALSAHLFELDHHGGILCALQGAPDELARRPRIDARPCRRSRAPGVTSAFPRWSLGLNYKALVRLLRGRKDQGDHGKPYAATRCGASTPAIWIDFSAHRASVARRA